jgi:hypothetical protein
MRGRELLALCASVVCSGDRDLGLVAEVEVWCGADVCDLVAGGIEAPVERDRWFSDRVEVKPGCVEAYVRVGDRGHAVHRVSVVVCGAGEDVAELCRDLGSAATAPARCARTTVTSVTSAGVMDGWSMVRCASRRRSCSVA